MSRAEDCLDIFFREQENERVMLAEEHVSALQIRTTRKKGKAGTDRPKRRQHNQQASKYHRVLGERLQKRKRPD